MNVIQKFLTEATKEMRWDVKGIIHDDNTISRLPPESRMVTELLQYMATQRLLGHSKQNRDIHVIENTQFSRSYPDVVIQWSGHRIAVDIKSARLVPDKIDRISRMTLGTYNGYFLHPNEKRLYQNRYSYSDYAQHWIIAIIYHWKPTEPTERMIEITSVCVGEKWQFAGKISGSGDTANIGGINSLKRLQNLDSVFKNNDEFEAYWRDYATKHPRKRTRLT